MLAPGVSMLPTMWVATGVTSEVTLPAVGARLPEMTPIATEGVLASGVAVAVAVATKAVAVVVGLVVAAVGAKGGPVYCVCCWGGVAELAAEFCCCW